MTVQPIARDTRFLSLDKAGHTFRLSYETGQEAVVLETLVEMVADPKLPFDWFDAAVMSHQLGEHLAKELRTFVPKKAA